MAKVKKSFFCQQCGFESAKWLGKCSSCNQWNTFVEEVVSSQQATQNKAVGVTSKGGSLPKKVADIEADSIVRMPVVDQEFSRVVGGGLVPGSLTLIGGEPGIGKSTLMLQLAISMAKHTILYVSGEESEQQIKLRVNRICEDVDQLDLFLLTETNVEKVVSHMEKLNPVMVVIDSIQTMHSSIIDSSAGSISQVKHCAGVFMKFCKESNTPVILIGHINKEGNLAGPKVLEHMVDTVLQFEGDRHMAYRILRTVKNRFGSTAEMGIYEMLANGMREVSNPSEILISQRDESLSGISIGTTMEGNRPLLVEIQALVSNAAYGNPQRSSTGFDQRRLNMLIAVLEKRGGLALGNQDVFLNVAGGLKLSDPGMDLSVCVSMASSYNEMSVSSDKCFCAEVGLGGEIRSVARIEQRIREAEKLGFKEIFMSKYNLKGLDLGKFEIHLKSFGKLEEIFSDLWG